jgi:hypothetical protein
VRHSLKDEVDELQRSVIARRAESEISVKRVFQRERKAEFRCGEYCHMYDRVRSYI